MRIIQLNFLVIILVQILLAGCATIKPSSVVKKGFTGVGLAAYYPFNGNANDESGNGYNGSVGNAVLTTDRFGKPNSAYEFNGKNSVIEILKGSELILNDSITVTAWINPTAETLSKKSQSTIFVQNDVNAGKVTHQVRLRTGKLEYDNWNPWNGWTSSQTNIEANKWSHITVVRDRDDVKIYINGLLDTSGTGETRVDALNVDNVLIGSRYYKKSLRDGFQGKLDEIRVYNKALPEQEIKKLYGGKSTVSSITKSNNPIAWWPADENAINSFNKNETKILENVSYEDGKVGKAFLFNGVDDYLEVKDNQTLNPRSQITVSAWIKLKRTNGYQSIVSKFFGNYTKGKNDDSYLLMIMPNGGLYWQVDTIVNGRVRDNLLGTNPVDIFDDQFHLIVGTYNGSSMKVFFDGQEIVNFIRNPGSVSGNIVNSIGTPILIGSESNRNAVDWKAKGNIDELRIYDTALSEQEIKELYSETASTKLPQADLGNEPCCGLNGEFSYSGRGVARVNQSGNDIQMYLTWIPKGKGPHYEIKGTLLGNIITGKWFSHYDNKGWFDFHGIVSPSGKMIDFSKTNDPLGSAMNNIVIINNSLLTDPDINIIEAGSVDGYMSKQEMQLRSKLEGTGIIVSREKKHIILKLPNNITFDTDSDLLKPRFTPILKSIVSVLKEYNSTLVTTIGHTDNVGADEYNQTLSEKRAKSLSNYLSNNGVNEKRLTSIGKGKFQPVSSNDTTSGRAMNRRVEIVLEPLHT